MPRNLISVHVSFVFFFSIFYANQIFVIRILMFFFTVIISYYSQETLQIGFQNHQEKINKFTCNFILSRVQVRQCSPCALIA